MSTEFENLLDEALGIQDGEVLLEGWKDVLKKGVGAGAMLAATLGGMPAAGAEPAKAQTAVVDPANTDAPDPDMPETPAPEKKVETKKADTGKVDKSAVDSLVKLFASGDYGKVISTADDLLKAGKSTDVMFLRARAYHARATKSKSMSDIKQAAKGYNEFIQKAPKDDPNMATAKKDLSSVNQAMSGAHK